MKIVWVGLTPPNIPSVGDHAQTLATEQWFHKRFPNCQIVRFYRRFPPPEGIHSFAKLEETVEEDDLIFLHSSGDWGTLFNWTGMTGCSWHDFRRRVVNRFQNNKIIQLPVTVFYENSQIGKDTLNQDAAFYSSEKKNVVITSRELASHNILASHLGCKTLMVPDFVFTMKPTLTNSKRKGALMIMRQDHEKLYDIKTLSWFHLILQQLIPDVTVNDCNIYGSNITNENREVVVNEVLSYIQKFKLVLTDRMHGMIFSAITNTPCVSVPDRIPHKSLGYETLVGSSIQFATYFSEVSSAAKKALDAPKQIPNLDVYYEKLWKWCIN